MRCSIGFAFHALLGLLHSADSKPNADLPLVDGQQLQDSINIERLLNHAENIQNIAYGSPERNRVVGSIGHNLTIDYIIEQLQGLDYYDIELQPFSATIRELQSNGTVAEKLVYSYNIIATTRSGMGSEILFVGAHSDSVANGPGINDNASGFISILEIAIQLAQWNTSSRVRFAWWTAEEQGLLGSTHYIQELSAAERANIRLYLNFDMVASSNYRFNIYDGDGSTFGLKGPKGSGEAEKMFEKWFDSKHHNHTASELTGRSDYRPFMEAGIPCGGLDAGADVIKTKEDVEKFGGTAGEPCDPYYHTDKDTVANLSPAAWSIMAKGIAHAVATYARSFDGFPQRIAEKPIYVFKCRGPYCTE